MTILDDIARYKRDEIAAAEARTPLRQLEERARAQSPTRVFLARLRAARTLDNFGIIAEVKRASPSRGLIRGDFDPVTISKSYEAGGADCLSVLTDGPSFQGAPEHLVAAREATSLPVLRKDFLFVPYQVVEARAWGADCILVILACVSDEEARALLDEAAAWRMDALVEVHDESELDRALRLDAEMIGINNRNLHTFETDLGTTERLAPRVPKPTLPVAESGIGDRSHMQRLKRSGVTTFLVGESLMREADPKTALERLLAR